MKRIGVLLVISIILSTSVLASSASYEENYSFEQNITPLVFSSMVWGDIDNDADQDLIHTGCISSFTNPFHSQTCNAGTQKIFIYLNNGSSLEDSLTFRQDIEALINGSLQLSDFDNDGKLDLFMHGKTIHAEPQTRIYMNNGTAFYINGSWIGLEDIGQGSSAIGDLNSDGKTDIILSGNSSNGTALFRVYLNTGVGFLENTSLQTNVSAIIFGTFSLVDIERDGDLDLIRAGTQRILPSNSIETYFFTGHSFEQNSSWEKFSSFSDVYEIALGDIDANQYPDIIIQSAQTRVAKVYLNNGSAFSENTSWQESLHYTSGYVSYNSLSLQDLDSDADLDLFTLGSFIPGNNALTRVYINNGSSFVQNQTWQQNLSRTYASIHTFIDIDKDRDQDLFISGCEGDSWTCETFAKVYLSNLSLYTTINKPQAPSTGFNVSYGDFMEFAWDAGSDIETASELLQYRLRIGTSSQGNNVFSGMIAQTTAPQESHGLLEFFENIFLTNTSFPQNNTYYWSVQTWDTSNLASSWSTEQSFYYDLIAPIIRLSAPANSSTESSSNTVLFNYTVTDSAISNCSISIDNTVHTTDTSITVESEESFSINLENGMHSWSLSCVDPANNQNISETWNFTLDYTAPSSSTGSGGSGGTSAAGATSPTTKKTIAEGVTNSTEKSEEANPSKEQAINESVTGNETLLSQEENNGTNEETGLAGITGAFIGPLQENKSLLIGVLLLLIASICFVYMWKRLKR